MPAPSVVELGAFFVMVAALTYTIGMVAFLTRRRTRAQGMADDAWPAARRPARTPAAVPIARRAAGLLPRLAVARVAPRSQRPELPDAP